MFFTLFSLLRVIPCSHILCKASLQSHAHVGFLPKKLHRPYIITLFSICFTVALPPFGNFDHVVVSVSINSLSN